VRGVIYGRRYICHSRRDEKSRWMAFEENNTLLEVV